MTIEENGGASQADHDEGRLLVTPPADVGHCGWAGRQPVSDADLARMTTSTPPIVGDPITFFTRMKMQEDGIFRLLFPRIPEGAPWWETGWSVKSVVKQVRFRADAARQMATRAMRRDEWRAWYRANRVNSRRYADEVRFKQKLAENMRQLGRVAALIGSAGRTPRPS